MSRPAVASVATVVALAVVMAAGAQTAPPGRLRGLEGLARAYDAILDARFDQADAALARACGPPARPEPLRRGEGLAPQEACSILRAAAIWWRLQLDPDDRSRDDEVLDAVNAAITGAKAWTARAPHDAEAWFYLGGAYGARAQWRVLRDERLSAARDGKRIKHALERAVALDPDLNDAYFGIGLYKYYADVAPAVLKIVRWLLRLPGGDRKKGLVEMLRARRRGGLIQGEADYQIHLIYLWYERRPDLALRLLEGLQERYPGNPLFPLQIAAVQDAYMHDLPASVAMYRSVLNAALEKKVAVPQLAEVRARVGLARQLDALAETDRSIEHLRAVVDLHPDAPHGVAAEAQLLLGAAHDRLGQRALAAAAYREAMAAAPAGDPADIHSRAAAALGRRPDERTGEAYRLSLEGWRALERGEVAPAAATLARALELAPGDAVARYRYGRALAARHDDDRALAEFERALADHASCPASIVAAAYLEAGRVHERAGRRDQAAVMYQHASRVFGGGAEMRALATRALARVAPATQRDHTHSRARSSARARQRFLTFCLLCA